MARETKKLIDLGVVQNFLDGMEYPAFRDDLVNYAIERGVPDDILAALERVPDRTYEDVIEVLEKLRIE